MDMIDWKMISVVLMVFQFIFTAVVFSVIKFNDFKHLEDNVNELKDKVEDSESKQVERHLSNITAINNIAVEVGKINSRCNTFHETYTK